MPLTQAGSQYFSQDPWGITFASEVNWSASQENIIFHFPLWRVWCHQWASEWCQEKFKRMRNVDPEERRESSRSFACASLTAQKGSSITTIPCGNSAYFHFQFFYQTLSFWSTELYCWSLKRIRRRLGGFLQIGLYQGGWNRRMNEWLIR